jgi:glycogen debranching enzyme GlgX
VEGLTGTTPAGVSSGANPPLEPGRAWPLGAHVDGDGVNVAVFTAHAHAVELCVFDADGHTERSRHLLPGHSGDVWHGRLSGAGAGLVYGLRVHGPWRPDRGHRFNPAKLLLDPHALEIVGRHDWAGAHFAAERQHPGQIDARDNARAALKARVVDLAADAFDWGDDRPPRHALADTVLYELHVKGWSQLNPAVPASLRGTYAGLGHVASIDHLRRLGITAVSLLPVQHAVDEERLARAGLVNYWGYNTIGFFSPDPRLAQAAADGKALRNEFRAMVRALHAAGIEVILDVVYNHTAEGDADGPSISFRGIDNASYYRLPRDALHAYENDTGCGNTLDLRQPRVLQFVMDSLRHWVVEMHVDGFRFDLATVLGRGDAGFDRRAAFFAALAQDPALAGAKLIAEPWDIGPGGYQLGNFPAGWAEWNDRFRDDVRAWWLRHPSTRGAFAQRLCGSSAIFQQRDRPPAESVDYIASHDGFTLADLLTYETKRNGANGEANRDGTANNLGFNCGDEGPSDDPVVLALRRRLQRALLATLLLAQGTPMLAAGDELGHSQHGNNNPYCQDNQTTWLDWEHADTGLIAFTARVLDIRRTLRPLATRWYSGLADRHGVYDMAWLNGDGSPLEGDGWEDPSTRLLGCLMGRPGRSPGPLLLIVNADPLDRSFVLPDGTWGVLLDTGDETTANVKDVSDDRQSPALRVVATPLPVAAATLLLLARTDTAARSRPPSAERRALTPERSRSRISM